MIDPSHKRPGSVFLFNLVGGCLTLFSLQLPWLTLGNAFELRLTGGLFAVAMYWILAGALLSFLSRYGGILTLVGLLGFMGEPYSGLGNVRAGEGFLLALGGAVFTLLGTKWSIPETLLKRRELMGGILYSVGFLIILTFAVNWFVYGGFLNAPLTPIIVQLPLLLAAAFMTVTGLKMYMIQKQKTSQEVVTKAI